MLRAHPCAEIEQHRAVFSTPEPVRSLFYIKTLGSAMSEAGPLMQRFLQGQPRVLGALLLLVGLLQVAFGVLLAISPCVYRDELHVHFYSAVLLLLAGIITLAADTTHSLALVKACLVIYIICTVVVGVINLFYLVDLVYDPRNRYIQCPSSNRLHCRRLYQISPVAALTNPPTSHEAAVEPEPVVSEGPAAALVFDLPQEVYRGHLLLL
ncbi:uncharacterized protein LOC128836988 isoform X2 [Malaclemys terrapin pileata]|uniref:uncharacterized protein LOC128836988 isoform X2 n=1 Tax=Malaclemys terrapin pileata TaxID=2991368 RepID=UPI0023A7EFCF|nr:uncharacterized protein LOC128836988 isoform X2 [Malaclemys terrapin pileata]